jgi:hypothetical protein
MLLTSSEEKIFKNIGINRNWFSRTTKSVPMISSMYFTATRNIMASDVVDVFENILKLGMVFNEYINIVPVVNKNYNHVFFKIQWNDTIETANFVNEIVVNSSVRVYHNKGYWVCRMNHSPLKLRNSKKCIKVASFYCDHSDSGSGSDSDSACQDQGKQNITIHVKEESAANPDEETLSKLSEEEEDFYVIKEEIIATSIE